VLGPDTAQVAQGMIAVDKTARFSGLSWVIGGFIASAKAVATIWRLPGVPATPDKHHRQVRF